MSAFQAYGGAYEFGGRSYSWRCYATVRVYEVRRNDHAPLSPAPDGKTWIHKSRHPGDIEFRWLVDCAVADFSQILLQIEAERAGRAEHHADHRASAALSDRATRF